MKWCTVIIFYDGGIRIRVLSMFFYDVNKHLYFY